MEKSQFKIFGYLLSGACLLVLFQNCQDVGFSGTEVASTAPIENSDDGNNDGQGELNTEEAFLQKVPHTPGEVFPKVDILFVVDESSSMNTVISELQMGFASLDASVFPQQTQIAFTNMAPAEINADGSIIPDAAFVKNKNIPELPGFLQLVSGDSIAQTLASGKVTNGVKNQFAEPGCSPWFAPTEQNANGVPCLEAASQIARLGIGVEAGVVTLFQLSSYMAANNEKLFRDGSIVNVIFVSDTHDPGQANYYGKSGAYPSLMPYETLKASIMADNPLIADLRFNGILPLPEVGNPALQGLKTLGTLAATLAEVEGINGEGLHDFAYLDYIKKSGGSAFHIVNSDWKSSVKSMIQTVGKSAKPLMTLPEVCPVLEAVTMDGATLETSEYTVIDSTTVRIEIENLPIQEYLFEFRCLRN